MQDCTKYILKKQCTNCFHNQEMQNTRCTQCGFLFIGEATLEEKNKAQTKLAAMHERAEKNEDD